MLPNACVEFKRRVRRKVSAERALDELEADVRSHSPITSGYLKEVLAALLVAIRSVREGNFSLEMLLEMTELVRKTNGGFRISKEEQKELIRQLDVMLAAEPH
jgi:hypothetical protein